MDNTAVNILLVDDEARNLDALESILNSPDYRLVRAQNADEALRALVSDTFAVLVLDVRMPDMSGLELAQLIKQRKKTQHLPIIFLTAYYQEDDHVMQGYGAGAVDYLSKPVNPAILRSKVGVFVDLFRKTHALESEIEVRRAGEQRIRDLNDQLALRVSELGAANAELEAFSYSVSHDLRAPLRHATSLVRMLTTALEEHREVEANEYIGLIEASMTRMGRLIEDMLAFSRVSKAEMKHAPVKLRPLLDEAILTLKAGNEARQIEWHIEPLPEVRGDPAMLRQVWANLLDNALKFTRPRSCARIGVGARSEPAEHVLFVRDNGVGFDQRFADKLFGAFQRLHDHSDFEGTGVGLASVRRIIARHGGRAWAESAPDQGTTVYFSLPKQPADLAGTSKS
ncbi:MAG TPA: response regulator [Candidatus Acidoferrum sp.]|nr:response regulator [Candidatus Acidoferrum sp.]